MQVYLHFNVIGALSRWHRELRGIEWIFDVCPQTASLLPLSWFQAVALGWELCLVGPIPSKFSDVVYKQLLLYWWEFYAAEWRYLLHPLPEGFCNPIHHYGTSALDQPTPYHTYLRGPTGSFMPGMRWLSRCSVSQVPCSLKASYTRVSFLGKGEQHPDNINRSPQILSDSVGKLNLLFKTIPLFCSAGYIIPKRKSGYCQALDLSSY